MMLEVAVMVLDEQTHYLPGRGSGRRLLGLLGFVKVVAASALRIFREQFCFNFCRSCCEVVVIAYMVFRRHWIRAHFTDFPFDYVLELVARHMFKSLGIGCVNLFKRRFTRCIEKLFIQSLWRHVSEKRSSFFCALLLKPALNRAFNYLADFDCFGAGPLSERFF